MPLQSKAASNSAHGDLPLAMADISASTLDWQSAGECDIQPSEVWQKWLLDSGSLTQLLIQKSRGNFRVEVIAEEWISLPVAAVRSCFGPLASEHKFWSRKVVLMGDNTPWVLAHTLIPRFSLVSPLKKVLELDDKPLGEYLFSHPDLIRSGMDITPFAVDSWGRRSLFYLFEKPIMVAEFFLPAILD